MTDNDFDAAASLHAQSRPHDELEVIALNYFMKMNQEQKKRHLDYVHKMLRDSAWTKPGDGIPSGTAERNRRFNKEEIDIEKFDNDLNDCLEAMSFNEETKQKAGDLFFAAVEARLFHEDDEFRVALEELLADCIPSPLISDEELDIAEILANRIEELEEAMAMVENENDALAEEIRADEEDYKADLQEAEAATFRAPKKSSLNEWMLEADESNADALFNGDREQHVGDPEMRAYLNAYRKEEF